jgi:mannose-1-phosphate guanylyltransferase
MAQSSAPSSGPQGRLVPVVLAGGSGTRFWPRSRKARAKQVLALSGADTTMIQETVARLRPMAPIEEFLVITNGLLVKTIVEQLPEIPRERIICEPCARNTAPACALAAMILEQTNPEAVMGIFPSDHVVTDEARFTEVLRAGVEIASAGENIVVLGAPPTRPETGYGYIQVSSPAKEFADLGVPAQCVHRFTEKPQIDRAIEFVAAGNYFWNAGIFLWSAKTLCEAIREHSPEMAGPLERIAAAFGTPEFESVFAEEYPKVENISIDYAVLEPRSAKGDDSHIYCLPADFGWNDLGSWAALYDHRMSQGESHGHANIVEGGVTLHLDAFGNYVYAPGKAVALLGVSDLVVVETEDAILITTRAQTQGVGRVVSELSKASRFEYI